MNQKLQAKIEKTVGNGSGVIPTYYEQDNFTVCILMPAGASRPIAVGVAKRNPNCDAPNSDRAQGITLARAVRAMSKKRDKK